MVIQVGIFHHMDYQSTLITKLLVRSAVEHGLCSMEMECNKSADHNLKKVND